MMMNLFLPVMLLVMTIGIFTTANAEKDISIKIIPVKDFSDNRILGEEIFHICDGIPGIIGFSIKDIKQPVSAIELMIDVPEGFEIIGATPNRPTRIDKNFVYYLPEKMQMEKITREGSLKQNVNYSRYMIAMSDKIVNPPDWEWAHNAYEYVYIKNTSGHQVKAGTAYWKVVIDRKPASDEKSFTLKTLPYPDFTARPLKRFGFRQYDLFSQIAPFQEVRNAYLKYFKMVHERPATSWQVIPTNNRNDWGRAYPDSIFAEIKKVFDIYGVFYLESVGFSNYLKTLDKANRENLRPLIQRNGQAHHADGKPFRVCYGFMAGNESNALYWEKLFPGYLKYLMNGIPEPDVIDFDFEPRQETWCCCEQCRDNFKTFAVLEQKPSIQEVDNKYKDQWFNFQVQLNGQLLKKCAEYTRKYYPKSRFYLCSDPLHAGGQPLGWCSLDPVISDQWVDAHTMMPYYSGKACFDDIALNKKTLKKPVYPILAPTCYDPMFMVRYTPQKMFQNILAVAANGCTELALYNGDDYDGLYLRKITQALEMIAKTENYYFAARNDELVKVKVEPFFEKAVNDENTRTVVSFPMQEDIRYTVFKDGGRLLLSVFNYGEKDIFVNIKVPAITGNYTVVDVQRGKIFGGGGNQKLSDAEIRNGFICPVETDGVRLLEFIPSAGAIISGETLSQSAFIKEFELVKAGYNLTLPEEKKIGDAEIGYGDINKDKIIDLKLKLKDRKMYVCAENGGVINGWKGPAWYSDAFNYGAQASGFADQIFVYTNLQSPPAKKDFNFKYVSAAITVNGIEAVLQHVMPPPENASMEKDILEGLTLTKEIELTDNGNTINIQWTFENANPRKETMPLAFRIKMRPCIGGKTAYETKKRLPEITSVTLNSAGEKIIIEKGGKGSCVFINKNHKLNFLDGKVPYVNWDGTPVLVSAGTETMAIMPDSQLTAGCYVYWNDAYGCTVELLTNEFTLPYGDKKSYSYQLKIK